MPPVTSPHTASHAEAASDVLSKPAIAKLSIIVPVYNEIRTLETVLDSLLAVDLPCDREIVVVDDCSADGSRAMIERFAGIHPSIRGIYHDRNQGKGAAIRTAIEEVSGDWVIIQDADLEYDPEDIKTMLVPVQDGVADAVFGTRFAPATYRRALHFWHTQANRLLTLLANMLADLNVTDMETCYKLIRADILKSLNIRSDAFNIEPELVIKLARWGARIYEVPISYRGRTYEEGKKIGARDALQALLAMIRHRFFEPRYCKHDRFLLAQALQRCRGYNEWLYSKVNRYVGEEVIEVGSGIGNLSRLLLEKNRLVCTDSDQFYVDRLSQKYGHLNNVRIYRADPSQKDFLSHAEEADFDSALCINLLEHESDDAGVLRNVARALKAGGYVIVMAPNGPNLYSKLDESLGHVRRYDEASMRSVIEQAGLDVVEVKGCNRLSALGWRVLGKWFGRREVSPRHISVLRLILPLIRLTDAIPFHRYNTLIGVAQTRDATPNGGDDNGHPDDEGE